ncbi:MAG: beta-ketoacyl-[acyl-carrier-protein] synthase family protein [Candidatus Sumerlaeaceae bacterium]
MNIVITGASACTALGSTDDQAISGLLARAPALTRQQLHSELCLWFGSVPDAPPLAERQCDHTSLLADCTARKCLLDANLNGSVAPDRVATIIGSSKGRLHQLLAAKPVLDPAEFPGETLGNEIAARSRFTGPVLNYPAACATGLVCLIAGANLLRDDVADAVLAGSAEASGYALTMASFTNMGALSPDIMRPFHRDRNGFNPGEGAAAFVLEREVDARARRAHPIARLAGYDFRSDAYHMTSADQSGEPIALSIRRTLKRAGWKPTDVQYINAHGTGTQLNDVIEARAIHDVFGDNCPPVSSLKPYIGHLLGASASAELALALVALRSGFIPPTPGLDSPDAALAPIHHVSPAGNHGSVSRFLKLSLGFGGHIACAAVELL